jgi:hypothetical protein
MISDSTRTIAAIIVVAMALAATTPLFVGVEAEGMSLRARDIGPWWQENGRGSPDYSHVGNSTFLENLTFAEIAIMSNGTSIITSSLFVFKSYETINNLFPDSFQNHWSFYPMAEKVDIGDQGYVYGYSADIYYGVIINGQEFHFNSSNIVSLVFVEDNVLSSITLSVKGVDTPAQPWIWDFILDLGMIQLQKIDRYSGN